MLQHPGKTSILYKLSNEVRGKESVDITIPRCDFISLRKEREGMYIEMYYPIFLVADVAAAAQADEDIQTIPTIGFNVETLQYKNIKFQVHFQTRL